MSKTKTTPEVAGVAGSFSESEVAAILRNFQVVRNPVAQKVIAYYPYVIGMVLVVDTIVFQGRLFLSDLPRAAGYICSAVAILAFVQLYRQVPLTLKMLWDRNIVTLPDGMQPASREYVRFVRAFEGRLNSRGGWWLGVATLPPGIVLFFWALSEVSRTFWLGVLLRALLSPLSAFLAGLILWRLLVIAYDVSRITRRFKLSVQPAHPDRCGGLAPLGDLCFTNALIVLGPALFFAGAVIVLASPDLLKSYPQAHTQILVFQIYFQAGLIQSGLLGLLVTEFLVFMLPLISIHQEMQFQSTYHQQQLDNLARRLDQTSQDLLDPTKATDPAEIQKRLDTLKSLRQVYQESQKFPVWPFDLSVTLKLIASLVTPLLSLTGIAKPILEIVGNVAKLIQSP